MITNVIDNQTTNELLNFNVVMLGAPGSGKTVFLASMLDKLSMQGELGFLIQLENHEQQALLKDIYWEVATGDLWPRGSRASDFKDWQFTCFVISKNQKGMFPACQFTYLDYPGQLLTQTQAGDEHTNNFAKKVEQADVLLGLLDGKKILQAMQGNEETWKSIMRDLSPVLTRMKLKTSPIHFVISKWDLIEDKFSLGQVRDRLLQYDQFRELIQDRSQTGSVSRLIPVSSIGRGFAVLESDEMKKIGRRPHPFQVEMPLACIIPDLLVNRLKDLQKIKISAQKEVTEVQPKFGATGRIFQAAEIAFRLAEDLSFDPITGLIFGKAADVAESRTQKIREEAKQRAEELRKQREETLKAVESQETAFRHTINSFLYLCNQLEMNFPDTKLTL